MVFPYQIRAARALLNWSQTELAERSGLSLSAVADCEKERGNTSRPSYDAMTRALEQQGVFVTANGVERRSETVYSIEGEGWWLRVLDDIYYSLIDHPGECLFMYADDRESSEDVNNRIRKLRNAGITMRQLVCEGNTYMMGPVKEYKWVPKQHFMNNVTLIYGDKLALCAEDNTKAVIFKDRNMVTAFRNTFEMLWNGTKLLEPGESTANDRF